MKSFKWIIFLLLLIPFNILSGQNSSIKYSFFIAGHTSGTPGVNNIGLHPAFKDKFDYIQSRDEIKFGVLLGDIVVQGGATPEEWDEVDADIESLGLPVYFAAGNHDVENRPLFESRYGPTYYSFTFHNDLFIVLDPNIDGWSIKGEQLDFLESVIDSSQNVNNIFVMFHQLLWCSSGDKYSNVTPNSYEGLIKPANFWNDIYPLFRSLPNEVFMCAGDMGATSWSDDFMYDKFANISFIGTGMGEGDGDNFIILNVNDDKTISYDLICLSNQKLNCFGDLTDYRISNGSYENEFTGISVYPNPATSFFNLDFLNEFTGKIQLINILGQIVSENQVTNIRFRKNIVSGSLRSLYIIKAENGKDVFTTKI